MSLLMKAGVSDFLGLDDTPAAYAGQSGKFPRVNAGEDALEFTIAGISKWTKVFDGPSGDIPTTATWGYTTSMPPPVRCRVIANSDGGLLYAFGGYKGGAGPPPHDPGKDVDVYDPINKTWTSKSDAAIDFWGSWSGYVGGLFYMQREVGGYWIQSYDPATDTWVNKAARPTSQWCAISNGIIYGGLIYFGTNPGAWRLTTYDPVLNVCADLGACANDHGYCMLGLRTDKIYATGGLCYDKCDEWDITGAGWAAKADLPVNHEANEHGGGQLDETTLYIFGGVTVGGTRLEKTSAYDMAMNTWSAKEDMPEAYWSITCSTVPHDSSIYVFGGAVAPSWEDSPTENVLRYTPAQVYELWSGTLAQGDAVSIYRPGGSTYIYADGKEYLVSGSGCVFPIFTDSCPVRVQIPFTDTYDEIEVWIGEVL